MAADRPRKKAPLEEEALYQYAIEALGRQMRTVAELKRLMRSKVESGEDGESKVSAVVARLKEQRYLDDTAYASTYARLRQDNDSLGKRRVRQGLARKGIHPELISRTLETAYQNVSEEELARRYLARKRISKPQSEREVARVARRLVAGGFSPGVISAILKSWEIDASEVELSAPDDGPENGMD